MGSEQKSMCGVILSWMANWMSMGLVAVYFLGDGFCVLYLVLSGSHCVVKVGQSRAVL